VILDVTGYFALDSTGSTYHSISPNRIVDTRVPQGLPARLKSGITQTFAVTGLFDKSDPRNVPNDASAITGNLTVTGQTSSGYLSLIDAVRGGAPVVSTLNFPTGDTRANGVTLPLGPGGTLSVTFFGASGATAQVIFDVTGYFSPGTDGAKYVAITPGRIADSRTSTGLTKLVVAHSQTLDVFATGSPVVSTAIAITGNLTVINQTWSGYVSMTQVATDAPATSTLNFPKGDVRANNVTMPLELPGGTLGVTYMPHTNATTDVIFDVTGYFIP
jgi:hypothetical protein